MKARLTSSAVEAIEPWPGAGLGYRNPRLRAEGHAARRACLLRSRGIVVELYKQGRAKTRRIALLRRSEGS